MIKYTLPTPSSGAVATHDGKYIFYLGKTVHMFSTLARQKIASLPRLGNALTAVSANDAYLGCIHPRDRRIEAVLYQIQEPPVEVFRIPLKGSFGTLAPCFTADSRYLLVTAGFSTVKLYAIDVETGEVILMHETADDHCIFSVTANRNGFFAMEHHYHPDLEKEEPYDTLLWFQSVTAPPTRTTFDASVRQGKVLGLGQDQLLLQYGPKQGNTGFEVIPFPMEPTFRPTPSDAFIPHLLILPPTISTDGRYMAFIDRFPGESGAGFCVYRMSDWTLVHTETQCYLWDVQFIPNTHDLIISGTNSRVITIDEEEGLLTIQNRQKRNGLVRKLTEAGFVQVFILDGSECGYPDEGVVILALWPYEAEEHPDDVDAWIHPYYFASQQAYDAAEAIVKANPDMQLALRDDDLLVKPIFDRMAGFRKGRNTLTYFKDLGSRFHVQIMTSDLSLPPTEHLRFDQPINLCRACQACVRACPTNALEDGVFHRERCIRSWQMSGQPIPEEIRHCMSNTLIGCDVCQRVCPHNPPPKGEAHPGIDLKRVLTAHKDVAHDLRGTIGVNLAYGNRVLAQGCLIAGCCHREDLIPQLEQILEAQMLLEHPSAAVVEHALWALEQIKT